MDYFYYTTYTLSSDVKAEVQPTFSSLVPPSIDWKRSTQHIVEYFGQISSQWPFPRGFWDQLPTLYERLFLLPAHRGQQLSETAAGCSIDRISIIHIFKYHKSPGTLSQKSWITSASHWCYCKDRYSRWLFFDDVCCLKLSYLGWPNTWQLIIWFWFFLGVWWLNLWLDKSTVIYTMSTCKHWKPQNWPALRESIVQTIFQREHGINNWTALRKLYLGVFPQTRPSCLVTSYQNGKYEYSRFKFHPNCQYGC